MVSKHKDYGPLLSFIQPPEVRVAVRRVKSLTYEFDVSESVSLNKDGAIANVQWDFDHQAGKFISTQGYTAGESYGQGSSREHAALCPMYLGVKAVIAQSFERIHIANLINFGIVPLTFKNEADYEQVAAGDEVTIPDIRGRLERGEELVLVNKTKNAEILLAYSFSDRQRGILLAGGTLNYVAA